LPVFFTVIVWEFVVPSTTLPKATLDGVRLICGVGAVAPVAVRPRAVGEPAALLVKVTVPLTAVVPVAAKLTLKVLFAPAAILNGVVRPLMLKPVPLMVAFEIVSVAVPGFEMVTVFELVVPSVTVPKATGEGLSEISGAIPAPDRGRVFGEVLALLVNEMLPEALPAVVGANFTLRVVEAPAATLTGVVNPLSLKPAPVIPTCDIVSVAVPGFDTVTGIVALLPTFTLPKAASVGFNFN